MAPGAMLFEDPRVGQRASLARTVSGFRIFAEVGGDTNRIHLSESFATCGLFGQRIARGMFTASLVSALLGTKPPGPGIVYLSQTIRFLAPVRIGDVATANAEVLELVLSRCRGRLFGECTCGGRAVPEGAACVAVEGHIPHA